MKRVYFCRCGPYDYLVPGMDLYDSFDAVASGLVDVGLRGDSKEMFENFFPSDFRKCDLILTAVDRRCVQTAGFIRGRLEQIPELKEIGYTMADFIAKNDFYDELGKPKVDVARKLFVRALVKDGLSERLSEVFTRIEALIRRLNEKEFEKAVVVTHSFFLRLVETYLKDMTIKTYPHRIADHVSGDEKFYAFFGGFTFTLLK